MEHLDDVIEVGADLRAVDADRHGGGAGPFVSASRSCVKGREQTEPSDVIYGRELRVEQVADASVGGAPAEFDDSVGDAWPSGPIQICPIELEGKNTV